jgi:GAG-pre-integrase domain
MQHKPRSKPCHLPICLPPIRHLLQHPKPNVHLEQPDPWLNSQQFCSTTIGLFLPNFAIPHSVFTTVLGIADSAALALHSPAAFHAGLSTTDSFPIVWDTGASYSLSPHESDFGETLQSLDTPLQLNGLASSLAVTQKGVVNWIVQADDGSQKILTTEAYFAPGANVRLLLPQTYMRQHNGTDASGKVTATVTARHFRVKWPDSTSLSIPFRGSNNLPVSAAFNKAAVAQRVADIHLCVTDASNQNLSEPQKELLRWHFRLDHINFDSIQLLLRSGALATSKGAKLKHKAAGSCPHPKCASCMYGKQKRSRTPGSVSQKDKSDGNLKKDDLFPGQRVSGDHFICSTEGRLYDSRGKTSKEKMYCGGCLFVDHATNLIHVEHQVSLTSKETLIAKHKFEAMARDSGVVIQSYSSDNGKQFTSATYTAQLAMFHQTIKKAGVGAIIRMVSPNATSK